MWEIASFFYSCKCGRTTSIIMMAHISHFRPFRRRCNLMFVLLIYFTISRFDDLFKRKEEKKFPVFLLLRFSSVADHFRSAQYHQMHYDYIALKSSLIVIFLCRQSLQETVEFWTSTKFDHTGQRSCPHFHFDQRGLFGRLLKWGKKQQ